MGPKDYELTNDRFLKEVQYELTKLKNSFESLKSKTNKENKEKKAKELDNINDLIQESQLEEADKLKFKDALNDLKKSIENINDENINNENLRDEFDKVTELLENLIHKELDDLQNQIRNPNKTRYHNMLNPWEFIREDDVKEGIDESSERIPRLINNAKNDKSWFIRNVIAKLLDRAYYS